MCHDGIMNVVVGQAYQYGNPRSNQWFEQWELKGDYTMRYFIEPVALVAAYAKSLGCENHHNTLSRLTALHFRAASLADEILCACVARQARRDARSLRRRLDHDGRQRGRD